MSSVELALALALALESEPELADPGREDTRLALALVLLLLFVLPPKMLPMMDVEDLLACLLLDPYRPLPPPRDLATKGPLPARRELEPSV